MLKNSWVRKIPKLLLLSLLIVTLVVSNSLGIVSAQNNLNPVSEKSTQMTIRVPNKTLNSQDSPVQTYETITVK